MSTVAPDPYTAESPDLDRAREALDAGVEQLAALARPADHPGAHLRRRRPRRGRVDRRRASRAV